MNEVVHTVHNQPTRMCIVCCRISLNVLLLSRKKRKLHPPLSFPLGECRIKFFLDKKEKKKKKKGLPVSFLIVFHIFKYYHNKFSTFLSFLNSFGLLVLLPASPSLYHHLYICTNNLGNVIIHFQEITRIL